ncbi:PTS glucitol/sorbitol transporter subunit IIA [Garciella nitratireducens]|uniref:PTS system, glucitol/sorbitol-specific IIA component n=1 Tax=Garciella nitratireducens DSM 15102 TaxID=1121911 RepID=A0A1T4P9Y5_9FIRM|nr:PTS glucitol/sorbitol transporter subunit IIA [Garciella nitratireducens]SJZ88385.1 PTS system, glucitol/sorbitol-specific IIA component [Garciella nitratireducens DSM 15102]
MKTIYKTKVESIGKNAAAFREEQMIVLFGKEAPSELAEYCYIVDKTSLDGEIAVGDILVLDHKEYTITAVGKEVNNNLANLAHITISFKGLKEAELAGTLYVEKAEVVQLKEGSLIEIKKNA